jgi:hypothetical protein
MRELSGGGLLTYIDGENLPEDRKDIFGLRSSAAPARPRTGIPIRKAA